MRGDSDRKCDYCGFYSCMCAPDLKKQDDSWARRPADVNPTVITLTTRMERVAEALFVEMLLAEDQERRFDTTVRQVAETAIARAVVFEKAWEARKK